MDSKSCLDFSRKEGMGRMKHLEIRHLWLRQALEDWNMTLSYIQSQHNPADLMTKQFTPNRLQELRQKIGLHDEHATDMMTK